jgi:hypothetical protein
LDRQTGYGTEYQSSDKKIGQKIVDTGAADQNDGSSELTYIVSHSSQYGEAYNA